MNAIAASPTATDPSAKRTLVQFLARHGLLGGFLGAMVMGLVGCSLTGGGWIPSLKNDGTKATFSFNATLPSDATDPLITDASIILHDRNYRNATFPKGVNVAAGPSAGLITPEEGIAVVSAPCTFNQGGNGGNPGTLVSIAFDTGAGGAKKGDTVVFVVYPFAVTAPEDLYIVSLLTIEDYFGGGSGILDDAIYINANTLGAGGNGGGNLYVDGLPVDLGGSAISLTVLGTLVTGAVALRVRSRRSSARA